MRQHGRSAARACSMGAAAHDASPMTRDNDRLCLLHQPGTVRADEMRNETKVPNHPCRGLLRHQREGGRQGAGSGRAVG